jgi:hypothetical protein
VGSNTFPSAPLSDESIGKSEAADVPAALFRRTPICSATCYDGCIAINAYPEISNDRGCCPEFWINNSGEAFALADQNLTCAGQCVVIGQNPLKGPRISLDPSLRELRKYSATSPWTGNGEKVFNKWLGKKTQK